MPGGSVPLSERVVVPILSKIVPVSPVSVAVAVAPFNCPLIEYGYGTSVRVKLRTISFALAEAPLTLTVPSPTTRRPSIGLFMRIEELLVEFAVTWIIEGGKWIMYVQLAELRRLAGKNPVCDCGGGVSLQYGG